MTMRSTKAKIYKFTQYGELHIGEIDGTQIYTLNGLAKEECGYIHNGSRVMRITQYGEQELGYFTSHGDIFSHGLFEGGAIGWVDEDGIVVQAGLILGEEEVGRIECIAECDEGTIQDEILAGAAALLLHFLPTDAEESKRQARRYQ